MSDSKLMDIEPGGEQTQYEGIRLFSATPAKQTGQLDDNLPHTRSPVRTRIVEETSEAKDKRDRKEDAKLAHKLELGERTSGISGYTNRGPVIPFPMNSDVTSPPKPRTMQPSRGENKGMGLVLESAHRYEE
ncbi:hypothetical protein BJX99DRAFT_240988 [Aspergillus californicus]